MPPPSSGVVVWTVIVGSLLYGLFVFIRFFLQIRQRHQFAKNFPGNPPHWLLGNIGEFPGINEEGYTWMRKMAGDFSRGVLVFWIGPFVPTIAVFHPETVKLILRTSEPKAVQLSMYLMVRPWLGDSLLLSGGKKWERNRRLLTPAFHFDILRPYMEVNNRCTDILIGKLEKFAERGEYFDIFTHVNLLTLDIILRCAFSYDNDCQIKGDDHPYVDAVESLVTASVHRALKPWLYPDFIFYLTPMGRQFRRDCDFVHGFADEVIRNRKAALILKGTDSLKNSRYLDFLDILLTARDSDGQGLTDQEIRDEADIFLAAGHHSTSSGISWALYSLAKYPEHLKRCQKEVDEILMEKTEKEIEYDDLPKLKYLTMCIRESLRIYTTVPFTQRETTKDITIDGRHVPAGTLVSILLYSLHHIKEVWTDPEEYRPDRFSPENMENMDAFAYCPFSAGPRNCIGQNFAMHEMKGVIAKIISRFDLSLDPEREARRRFSVVTKAENGIYMKAKPRRYNVLRHLIAPEVKRIESATILPSCLSGRYCLIDITYQK